MAFQLQRNCPRDGCGPPAPGPRVATGPPASAGDATRLELPTEYERFMAAIVESAEDCIFAKSLDGQILSWNAGAERMYGYGPDKIVGDFVFRLAPPDRRHEVLSILERVRAGARIDHFETIRVRTADPGDAYGP